MQKENVKYLIILFAVLVLAIWIDYLVKSSENKEYTSYITGIDERIDDPREERIPAYKLKKCGHLLNNRYCRWCRYYRFHPNDKKFYRD